MPAPSVRHGELTARVSDDGRGIDGDDAGKTGRGLANMARRAEGLGGRCTVGPAPMGSGTKVEWRVPARVDG
jgi:signal transduction histidine kinase